MIRGTFTVSESDNPAFSAGDSIALTIDDGLVLDVSTSLTVSSPPPPEATTTEVAPVPE